MLRLWVRLITGVITPLFLGSLGAIGLKAFGSVTNGVKSFIFILLAATVFMGIQAVIYSLSMEWLAVFLRKRGAHMGLLVLLSTILGGLAGGTAAFLMPGFIGVGLAVGFCCGLILWALHQWWDESEITPERLRKVQLLRQALTGVVVAGMIGDLALKAIKFLLMN